MSSYHYDCMGYTVIAPVSKNVEPIYIGIKGNAWETLLINAIKNNNGN